MITGDHYIALASSLASAPNAAEASYRSAVSRAYYGAFHLAAVFIADRGFSVPKGANAHGWIPQVLIGTRCQEAEDAGRLLQGLHAERIIADYRWERPATGNQADAKTSVATARAIRASLIACNQEPMHVLVTAGIESYLQKRGDIR